MSSDSENERVARPRKGSPSVADNFANISDDDSDEGRLRDVRSPTPPPNDDDIKGVRSDSDVDEQRKSSDEDVGEEEERHPRNEILDAHVRRVVKRKQTTATVDLLHFPPTLEMNMVLATDADIPENQAYPMAFRAARGAPSDVPRALMQALRRGPLSVCDVLESNARLVEWSDGSRTVMVGDEHYEVVGDKLVSDFYLFRKGEDVQTFEASVESVGRLQPCNLGGMSAQIANSQTPGSGRKEVRTIMRTMKEGGEQEEKLAKEEADRKERDRARRESKRRASMGSQPRTQGIASPVFESEPEPSEDETERIAEEQRRLSKRRRTEQFQFKTRKAGGRRVVDSDEDSDDDDE